MNKSGNRFNEVIRRVQSTIAASLSKDYAELRNAIIRTKVEELKGQLLCERFSSVSNPTTPAIFLTESTLDEARSEMQVWARQAWNGVHEGSSQEAMNMYPD